MPCLGMDADGGDRPCQDYVTSSGTGGSTLVWDLRNPLTILTELKHDGKRLLSFSRSIHHT